MSLILLFCCAARPHQKRALQGPWSAAATTDEQRAEPAGRWQYVRASSVSAPRGREGVCECQWALEREDERSRCKAKLAHRGTAPEVLAPAGHLSLKTSPSELLNESRMNHNGAAILVATIARLHC